jgi:hypothetical protein
VIVDHYGEMVGRETIALESYEVIELGGLELYSPLHHIVPGNYFGLVWDHETQDMRFIEVLGMLETVAIVLKGYSSLLGIFAQSVETFGSTPAGIKSLLGDELIGVLAVNVEALRLDIGSILPFLGSVWHDALVGIDLEPLETLADRISGFLNEALAVGVLKAQDEGTISVLGDEVIKECRTNSA